MKKGKIINVVLVTTVVLLLGVFAFSVRIRPTVDSVAMLRTSGMTCGGCKANIEKALQANKGVAAVEIDVEGGRVVIGYDSKKTEPEELASMVTGAGYGSRVANLLSVEQFRAMTGRYPGEGQTQKIGCGCGVRN